MSNEQRTSLLLKGKPSAGGDDIAEVLLDFLEPHEPTAFALEVIDDGRKTDKLFATADAGAMVQLLLVCGPR